jgi:hypothetical protein
MKDKNTGNIICIKDGQQPLTADKCRATLNRNGITYTHEEVIQIRDYLYRMAATVWDEYQKQNIDEHNSQHNYIPSAA